MTREQVERWKTFTRALCYWARPEATEQRKQKLWMEAEEFIEEYADEPVDGWDNNYCLCDFFYEHFQGHFQNIWQDKDEWYKDNPRYFANHLSIALRAGINAAIAADGISVCPGVLGFTVGDLRQMFNGEIPEWLSCQFQDCLSDAPNNAGIFL